jgi:hypothetical protein
MLLLVLPLPLVTGDTRDEKLFSAAVLSALNVSSPTREGIICPQMILMFLP